MSIVDLYIASLAAGGDGVARDASGRVTFVPRTAPGDRVRVKLVTEKASFARGELLEVLTPSPSRVAPACSAFDSPGSAGVRPPAGISKGHSTSDKEVRSGINRGCGGCHWLHVSRPAQLEAKQTLVASALRGLDGLVIEPIADPAPSLGWRRRARFHSRNGRLGLYAGRTREVVPLTRCPQLDPALDVALQFLASKSLPDGEVSLLANARGEVAVGIEREWAPASALIGHAGIVGVCAGANGRWGEPVLEIDADSRVGNGGVWIGPWDFAQASAAGNAALVEIARTALGLGPGVVLELYAGSGNFTRAFSADGWTVHPTDIVEPARAIPNFSVGPVEQILASAGSTDVVVLDPPREGAAAAITGIAALAPRTIVYVSCDPATLARDASRIVAAGYRADRAWPVDLMPQTAHVEVVLRLVRTP